MQSSMKNGYRSNLSLLALFLLCCALVLVEGYELEDNLAQTVESGEPQLYSMWKEDTDEWLDSTLLKNVKPHELKTDPPTHQYMGLLSPEEAEHIVRLVLPTLERERPKNATVGHTITLDRYLGVEDKVVGDITSRLSALLGYEPIYFSKPEVTFYHQKGQTEQCRYDFDITEDTARNVHSDPEIYHPIFRESSYVVGENVDKIASVTIPLTRGFNSLVFPLVDDVRDEDLPSVTAVAKEAVDKIAPVSDQMCDTVPHNHRFPLNVGDALVVQNTRLDGSARLGSYHCMCPTTGSSTLVLRIWVHSQPANRMNDCHMLLHVPHSVSMKPSAAETYMGCRRRHMGVEVHNPYQNIIDITNPLTVFQGELRPEFTLTFFVSRNSVPEVLKSTPIIDIGGTVALGVNIDGNVFIACRNIEDADKPKVFFLQQFEDSEAFAPRDSKYRHVSFLFKNEVASNATEVTLFLQGEELDRVPLHPDCFRVGNASSLERPLVLFHLFETEIADFTIWGYPLAPSVISDLYHRGRDRLPVPKALWPTLEKDITPKAVNRRMWGKRFEEYPFYQLEDVTPLNSRYEK